MDETLELLLHPVRWQIVQHLAQGPLTSRELHERMGEVTQATLYRQVRALAEAEVIAVVREEQVRGAVERTYALGPRLDMADQGAEARRGQAALVLALLQNDVDAYLRSRGAEDRLGGFTLTRSVLYMTEVERRRFQAQLEEWLSPFLSPREGAHPHTLGVVLVPHGEEPAER